jgi:uncharacterized protein YjbI with pentapeptide repeats
MTEEKKKEKKICKSYGCNRKTWQNDEHCIFHSKDIEGKKDEFNDAFREEFERQKKGEEKYDFMGFVFPDKFNLEGANLRGANLREADLIGANLIGADLIDANLIGADLFRADLRGANLTRANLNKAFLERANFKRAKLWETSFENANVSGIKYDRYARYKGIKLSNCFGSPRFLRFAKDQEYIEDFRKSTIRFPVYLLWLILADCGRSLLLWASWAFGMALFFAVKFFSMGPEAFEVTNLGFSFETMTYYSVVTFTTLGFGDVIPNTIEASKWVMLEVILGYVMLGGLISILANKLARRS